MKKSGVYSSKLLAVLLSMILLLGCFTPAWAEEDGGTDNGDSGQTQETEYIPDTYYDPIQTNDLEGWPQGPAIQAQAGIVMDMDTGAVLYSKNANDRNYPASITKIMTTMVALEHGNLNDKFTCGEEVLQIESDSTHLWLEPGETLTLRQALFGVMLYSANDMANAVAVHIAGSVEAFADLMNEKAESLGCKNTHFVNPSGLHDDNHYTSAADMAKIARAAYRSAAFRTLCSTTYYTIPKTNKEDSERYLDNHHKILQKDSGYYQEWCTGGKTGYTMTAWNTLVTYGEKDGKRLVCVLLHENGPDKAYNETTTLMNYGFDNFSKVNILESSKSPTFYEVLGFGYLVNNTELQQSEQLKQPAIRVVKNPVVTLPNGVGKEDLTVKVTNPDNGTVVYSYKGWAVGNGRIQFTSFPTDVTFDSPQTEAAASSSKPAAEQTSQSNSNKGTTSSELQQTLDTAWHDMAVFAEDMFRQIAEYVNENTMTVLLAGALVLLVLILLLVIVIMRCTRDYRRQKRREAEQRELERKEAEIEKRSALEIEQELRAAMAAEEERRKREEQRAKEVLRAEDELSENERIIENYAKRKKG